MSSMDGVLWNEFVQSLKAKGVRVVEIKDEEWESGGAESNDFILSEARMINSCIAMRWDQGWHNGNVRSKCTEEKDLTNGNNFKAEFCNALFPIRLSVEK